MLRPAILALTLLFSTQLLPAQRKFDFDSLLTETNACIALYDGLSPMGGGMLPTNSELGLPPGLLAELQAAGAHSEDHAQHGDSIEEYELILYLQEVIVNDLYRLLYHPEFADKNPSDIFDDGLFVVASPDDKLYNFVLDEKTGGSYRSMISLMYDRDYAQLEREMEIRGETFEGHPYDGLEQDGYGAIDTIHLNGEVHYLLTGSVLGCNTCLYSHLTVLKRGKFEFEEIFRVGVESRGFESVIDYDPLSRRIRVSYVTDDLSGSCLCDHNDAEDYNEEGRPCDCEFKWNGETFEQMK